MANEKIKWVFPGLTGYLFFFFIPSLENRKKNQILEVTK